MVSIILEVHPMLLPGLSIIMLVNKDQQKEEFLLFWLIPKSCMINQIHSFGRNKLKDLKGAKRLIS